MIQSQFETCIFHFSNILRWSCCNTGFRRYILKKGESIGSFYGFKTDGLYTQADIDAGHYYTLSGVVPNAGDIKFVPQRDIEYKQEITDEDRTILGKDVPDFTYGVNLSLQYKGFEFSMFGQGIEQMIITKITVVSCMYATC